MKLKKKKKREKLTCNYVLSTVEGTVAQLPLNNVISLCRSNLQP